MSVRYTVSSALALLLVALTTMHCSSTTSAGGATDSPNSRLALLVGTAVYHDSTPAANVVVRLRSSDYTAAPDSATHARDTSLRVDLRTDSVGSFSVDSLPVGAYFVEVNDSAGRAAGIALDIDTGVTQRTLVLEAVSTITGTIILSASPSGLPTAIQIVGLERVVIADSATGAFRFDDLPAGTFTVRAFPLGLESAASTVDVPYTAPGDSSDGVSIVLTPFTNENYASWQFSRQVSLNTTASGAGISEDVHRFPVLLRLDSSALDFSQAQPDGADIRFAAQPSGARLAYEIEQWDRGQNRAAVWVLLDTIAAAAVTQIVMYWGNDSAINFSNSRAVFDSSNNFAGVWHMTRIGATVPDATPYGNHGTAVNYADTSTINGTIGIAQTSSVYGHFIEVPDAPSLRLSNALTLSAWVKGKEYNSIIRKSDNYALYLHAPWAQYELHIGPDTAGHYCSGDGQIDDTAWNYIAVAYDGFDFRFQINGVGSISSLPFSGQFDEAFSRLELQQTGLPMDEVRVEQATRSAAWLKLCYENQRPDQTLVEFGP